MQFSSPIAQIAGSLHGRVVRDEVFAWIREHYTAESVDTFLPAVPEGTEPNTTTRTFAALLVGFVKVLARCAPDAVVVLAVGPHPSRALGGCARGQAKSS